MANTYSIGGAQDLSFEYTSHGQVVRGFVNYIGAPPVLEGDYNEDGKVDAADYVVWRKNPGAFGGDPAGYNAWRTNFGRTSGGGASSAGAAAVPEPGTWVLASLVSSLLFCKRRRAQCLAPVRAKGSVFDSNQRRNAMANRSWLISGGVAAAAVSLVLAGSARATQLDRDYQFSGNGNDSAAPADNLIPTGGPTFVSVSDRPGGGAGQMVVQLNGASSQYLDGFGFGSPTEGAPVGVSYPESRLMQVWVKPTTDNGARQEVVSDTFQFGIFLAPTAITTDDVEVWGHTYGSDVAPANLGDDFLTNVPVAYNQWTHIMQRTFENDGVVLYVNGVAISRFNADYEVTTLPISPAPNLDIYVGAGSGGASNFLTGQVDSLKIGVAGQMGTTPNYGPVNLAVDNDYIAFALPNMNFVNGDVNGDGVVNGNGTGPVGTDDVSFFVNQWRIRPEKRINNILVGDLTTRTTMADLNFDGRISLADWGILRAAHVGGASLDLEALLAGVPEPSTGALMSIVLLSLAGLTRRRAGC
jgi:hypothetical protein